MITAEATAAALAAPRILVAEDDPAMRALLRAALERSGYEVEEASNGLAALEAISRRLPDVALLDIGMPEMDGLTVTRLLRSRPESALLPIILVTARGRTEDKVSGLDAGASDFVTKPFEPAELVARVRTNLRLTSALARLENVQDVLAALANAVDARDSITEHHCERVADLAVGLAQLAGLGRDETEAVGYGGLLHDIGKIGIAEAVLMKPGALTDDERIEMRRHPIVGATILAPLRLGRVIGPIVRGHHERWDGAGYPDGLHGESIPVGSRIVAIVDAYDAMTHDRPYRRSLGQVEARHELEAHAGSQFDPNLVRLFLDGLDAGMPIATEPHVEAFTRRLRLAEQAR